MPTTDSTGEPTPVSGGLPPISAPAAQGTPTATPDRSELLPGKIGPYTIQSVLGSGGMGVVYRAEQQRPHREVALKMIRPGTATPERLRRFEFEAQVLGRLEHPGIARIYQADTADAGHGPQPYFAMELVRGEPLTAYADRHRLDLADRLRLVIQVCQAVQYAHQQGVVHRDLKPANVLVDQAGQPRVLDFGVARVTDGNLAGSTLHTDEGQLVGTLPYMSPEQVGADPRLVDWRSDVYTLGVICFELVAGRLPLDLKGKPVAAAVQALTRQEPTRLSAVSQRFRGDLDTVLARALDRDRLRRYQSAADFAADLESYLEDRPVKARPAGVIYQLGKFVRRNRAAVAGLLVVLGVLIAATVVSARWAVQAGRAEQAAQDALADSHEQAARLALQRGAWREALDLIDKALASERYRGSIPLRLNKVRALMAIQHAGPSVQEIEALAREPNLGEYEGRVLLLQADVLLGRDDARAIKLVGQALARGLPEEGKAYARALLAKSMPEAIEQLQRSLAHDRHQLRGRTMLELLLVLLVRLGEARTELAVHEALFPEDPNARVLRILVAALERKQDEVDRTLAGLRGWLSDAQRADLRSHAGLLMRLRDPANKMDPLLGAPDLSDLVGPVLNRVLPHLWHFVPGAFLFRAPPRQQDAVAVFRGMLGVLPLPPVLRQKLFPTLFAIMGSSNTSAIDRYKQALEVYPEGTLRFRLALLLLSTWKWDEAERHALEAARTPALFPIRRPALLCAALAAGMLYGRKKDPCLLPRIVEPLHQMRAVEPRSTLYQPELAVLLAKAAKEINLARLLLDDWQRQQPGNLAALRQRAEVEFEAEAYGPAVKAAEQVLRKEPGNARMRKIRDQAARKVR